MRGPPIGYRVSKNLGVVKVEQTGAKTMDSDMLFLGGGFTGDREIQVKKSGRGRGRNVKPEKWENVSLFCIVAIEAGYSVQQESCESRQEICIPLSNNNNATTSQEQHR